MLDKFISDIKLKLKIEGGYYVDAEITDYIKNINPLQYKQFFKDLSGDEFQYKNGLDRVKIVSERYANVNKSDMDLEAEVICSLLHSINKTALHEAEAKGEGYKQIMASMNIRVTFSLSDMQAWVINEIGGRNFIMDINRTEPNSLHRMVLEHLNKYERRDIMQIGTKSNVSALISSITRESK